MTIAALNGLLTQACDIHNAYLTAPCCEKIYTTVGPKFGSEAGKNILKTRQKPLSGTYERARDAFRRCLTLRSSNIQHQLWSPVKGLTSRILLWECKGFPTRSLPYSLCAYKNLVREKTDSVGAQNSYVGSVWCATGCCDENPFQSNSMSRFHLIYVPQYIPLFIDDILAISVKPNFLRICHKCAYDTQ